MQQRSVNVQEWEAEDLLGRRGAAAEHGDREGPPDTPVGDDEATDALLSLAGPRAGAAPEGVNSESWKYSLIAPQGRPNRPPGHGNGVNGTAGGRPRASSIGRSMVMNSGDELPEDGGEPMLDDPSPTPAGGGRRGPYRRSTLDHMICQVEGCGRELATLSPYHRRYRICEMHFKLDVFVRDGRRQRFCQQCGRCHDLNAFEGSKRSCRNRLNQHNARRRKKNPGGGGNSQQHEKTDMGAPLPANVPRGSRSGPSLTRPNAIRSSGAGPYPPTPGLQFPIGSDEGVGNVLHRLSQGNMSQMGGPHGGLDGMGFGNSSGQYGSHAGSKRGGQGLAPEAKRRNSGENAGFAAWQNHLGSGASSAFSGPRAQLGKGGASAFAPPGRENERGRTQSSETSDGQGQDDGLDPGLAAPGMAGHVGTMGGNESPSPTRHGAAPMSAMYPMMAAAMSPGSGPLGPHMPMGFPPGAMAGHPGMWPHPAAMAGNMSNDPATLALQTDLLSAQISAMGAPHMGPTMGMAPGAQHAQTVQMLQAQLLRYQYMLHAMVTGAWPSGGPPNPNQMAGMPPVGMDGLGFPMPPMSGGVPGMLPGMDPMLMAMQPPMPMGQPSVAEPAEPVPAAPAPAQDMSSPFGSALPPDPPPAPAARPPSPPKVEPAFANLPAEAHALEVEMLNMNRANSMPNVGTATSVAPMQQRMGPPRPVLPPVGRGPPPPTWPGPPGDAADAAPKVEAAGAGVALDGESGVRGEPGDALPLGADAATVALPDGSSLPISEVVSRPNQGLTDGEVVAPVAGEPAPATDGKLTPENLADDAHLPTEMNNTALLDIPVPEAPVPVAVTAAVSGGGSFVDISDKDQMALKIYGCTPGNMSPASRQKFEEWFRTAPCLEHSKSGTKQEQTAPSQEGCAL